MRTIDEIEKAVLDLPPEKLAEFRDWFARFDAAQWDRQLASDAANGRLDKLAEQAIRDLRQGRCSKL